MNDLRHVNAESLNTIANIISAKKYSYNFNYSIDQNIQELAQNIFGEKSILLFESSERRVANDLDNILSQYISDISRKYFIRRQVDDEVLLLNSTYSVNNNFLNIDNLKLIPNQQRFYSSLYRHSAEIAANRFKEA